MQVNIYVMEERWVLVGVLRERSACGMKTVLGASATIRVWGTKEGLGELARLGPRTDTKLDPEPDGVEINERYVMRTIPCNVEAWAKWIRSQTR